MAKVAWLPGGGRQLRHRAGMKAGWPLALAVAPGGAAVEVAGPSVPVALQLQVPATLLVTVPLLALRVTVALPSASEKVPVCVARLPSAALVVSVGASSLETVPRLLVPPQLVMP